MPFVLCSSPSRSTTVLTERLCHEQPTREAFFDLAASVGECRLGGLRHIAQEEWMKHITRADGFTEGSRRHALITAYRARAEPARRMPTRAQKTAPNVDS